MKDGKLKQECERIERKQFAKECKQAQDKVLSEFAKELESEGKTQYREPNNDLTRRMPSETFRLLKAQHQIRIDDEP